MEEIGMKKKGLVLFISAVFAFQGMVMPIYTHVQAATEESVSSQEIELETDKEDLNLEEDADTVKPVLKGVKNQSVFVKEKVNYLKGVTATDDVDGNLTKKIKVDATKVNLKKPGKYTVTYSVTDKAGNKTVKKVTIRVKKDKAPVIKGVRNQTIYLNNPISYKKGVTATDDKDGNLTKKIKIDSSKVNKAKVGKYPVTYTVRDSAGNKTVKKAYVTVKKFVLRTVKEKEGKEVTIDTEPGGEQNIGTW